MAQTKLVLTEDIYKLGSVGDLVTVKAGYARNYLIPKGYGLRATKANLEFFEVRKAELEETARKNKEKATEIGAQIDKQTYTYVASASERGMLYGAITPTVVANLLAENGIEVHKNTIQIKKPIKILGLHDVRIALHNDVSATITLNLARTEQEAQDNLKELSTQQAAQDDLDALNITDAPSETPADTSDAD